MTLTVLLEIPVIGIDIGALVFWGAILLLMRFTLPKIFSSARGKPSLPVSGLRILSTVKLTDFEERPKLLEIARQIADLEIKVMNARGQMAQANQSNALLRAAMGGGGV